MQNILLEYMLSLENEIVDIVVQEASNNLLENASNEDCLNNYEFSFRVTS